MRIENNQNLKLFNAVGNSKVVEEKKRINETEQNDSYQFNVDAGELNEFFQLAAESTKERDDVIEAFRKKYESGSYNVTGEDLINKLMEENDGK